MTNLTTAPPLLERPNHEEQNNLLAQAKFENSWECLKPYPMLLYIWQRSHKEDMMVIAKWVSHFRTLNHKWCKNCETVEPKPNTKEFTYINAAGEPMPF